MKFAVIVPREKLFVTVPSLIILCVLPTGGGGKYFFFFLQLRSYFSYSTVISFCYILSASLIADISGGAATSSTGRASTKGLFRCL